MLINIANILAQTSAQALITLVTTYATVIGVVVSIATVILAFKKMKREHELRMATKEDVRAVDSRLDTYVGVVDSKLEAYMGAHRELHKREGERVGEIHNMVQFLYQAEINRKK